MFKLIAWVQVPTKRIRKKGLNNKEAIRTGTASSFWNSISSFERPRTRLVGKIGSQDQSTPFVYEISRLKVYKNANTFLIKVSTSKLTKLFQCPTLVFWAQVELEKSTWQAQRNLTSQVDNLRLSSWLVTLASSLSSNQLTSDSLSSQLVKSTWKVTPPKSHAQAVWRTPPRGPEGAGSGHGDGQKKGRNLSLLNFFVQQNIGENDDVHWINCHVFHNERPTSTWQCCCSVGGFSAVTVDRRQYVRQDMPVTVNCVLLPLHSHILLTLLSLWAECSCVLLCFINPILGNRYGPGVSSCQQTSDAHLGWQDPHPPP